MIYKKYMTKNSVRYSCSCNKEEDILYDLTITTNSPRRMYYTYMLVTVMSTGIFAFNLVFTCKCGCKQSERIEYGHLYPYQKLC